MVGTSHEEVESSNYNKQLIDSFKAMMNESMATMRAEMRAELRARQRREQELKPKPPDNTSSSAWSSPQKISHTTKSKSVFHSVHHHANELFKFSGKRSYLEWEENMDDWFYYNRIPKEKRIAHAIRQLTGDAYQWWIREVDDRWNYKEPPITSWRDLKKLMRKKYEPKVIVPKEVYTPQPKKVPKLVLSKKMEAKPTSQPKKVAEQVEVSKQSLNPSLESSGEPKQCKFPNLSKSKEITCYKCREKGHFAATCPEKHKLDIISLASIQSSQNSSSEVVNQSVETSSSCMMHLVLSKDVDSGHTMEHKDGNAEGSTKEKTTHSVSTTSQACQDDKYEQTDSENLVVTKPYPTPADCVSNITIFKAEMLPNILHGTQVSLACEYIRYWNNSTFTRSFKQPVLNVEISSIMHLIFPLSAKEDTGIIDVCKDMPSNSELMTCSLANKRSKEVSNTFLKEQTESKTVEQFPCFKKSLEAKCILSSTQSDFMLEKLTSLEPVQPSSIVCFSQILEEESPKTMPRSLPLINELGQPTSLVPKHVLMPFPFDYPRKHCKEIDLVRTEPNLFVMVSAQEEKRFGLENVKEFCVSKSVFDKIIPTFETFTLERFFELNGFMFEGFFEFDSSLKVSLCTDAFELFRTKTENALVKTFSELKHVIKNEWCDSNLFNVLCKPTVNNHVLEFSTSSIMHLFCPMSVEKGTGCMENHKYLRELTIKEKPPDLHQPQSIGGARKELTCFIQIKEDPPDLCQPKTYHFGIWNWKYLRKTTSITQGCFIPKLYFDNNYMIICSIFFFVPKLFPFDVGDPAFLLFKSTNQDHGKVAKESSMFKDKPPDPIPFTLMIMITEHIENLIQISISLSRFLSYDSRAVIMSSIYLEIIEKMFGLFKKHLELNYCLRTQVKEKYGKDNSWVRNESSLFVYCDSMTLITHLLFAKGVDYIAGTKEEPPDLEVLSSNYFVRTGIGVVLTKELNMLQISVLEEMIMKLELLSKALKENFHDAKRIINLLLTLSLPYLIEFYMPLLFDASNLALFVADRSDLRSNPFQVGEDDVILESTRSLDHGRQLKPEELVAKDALEVPFGSKTCLRTRMFHKEFRVSLRQVKIHGDHLSSKDCIKTSMVKIHVQDT